MTKLTDAALAPIDHELRVIRDRRRVYRDKAENVFRKRGARDMHADRLVEWAELRLEQMTTARHRLARLIAAACDVDHATDAAGPAVDRLRLALAELNTKGNSP